MWHIARCTGSAKRGIGRSTSIMSRSDDHIVFLDQVRGVAILLVVGFHALGASFGMDQLQWHGWFRDFNVPHSFLALLPLTLGWSGVPIFFVVSGFCIHLSHKHSKQKSLSVFFVRRFFRIYPPYLVALAFFAFLFPLSRVTLNSLHDVAQVGSHILLIHNFDNRSFFGINSAFWSIAVEVQLYVLYPLLLLVVRRFGWRGALWATGATEVALRSIAGAYDLWNGSPPPAWFIGNPFIYWFSWSIGAGIADDCMKRGPIILSRSPVWVWPTVALVSYFFRPLSSFCPLIMALAAANIISVLLTRPDVRLPVPRVVRDHLCRVGVLSYSLYLLHQPPLGIAPWALRRAFPNHHCNPLVIFLGCLLCYGFVLAASRLFFKIVELPSIELGKWIVRTRMATAGVPKVPVSVATIGCPAATPIQSTNPPH